MNLGSPQVGPMKIGMELDPIEELDREEEQAIAALIRARVGNGDLALAKRAMDVVSAKRAQLRAQYQGMRHYA